MPLLASLLLILLTLMPLSASAQGYDSGAPCGRDANGIPLPCHDVRPNMLEATCTTSANPHYCLPYHQRACQTGFALACRAAALGQHCYGGDPATCQYYVALLAANRDCALSGNRAACDWIARQRY